MTRSRWAVEGGVGASEDVWGEAVKSLVSCIAGGTIFWCNDTAAIVVGYSKWYEIETAMLQQFEDKYLSVMPVFFRANKSEDVVWWRSNLLYSMGDGAKDLTTTISKYRSDIDSRKRTLD